MMWVWTSSIKGKLQTGDKILFVDGIDAKTININRLKEHFDAAAIEMDKTMRLQVQHDKGDWISESFSILRKMCQISILEH